MSSIKAPWHRKTNQGYKASVPGLYFHESTAPVKLFGGAVGGTKTTTLATDVIYLSLKYDNNRGFCGERDFDDLRRGLYAEIMDWLPENAKLADGREFYVHNKSEHWLKFYNGSEIHFVELKDEPRNVNLGWAAIDQAERVPEKSFEWMQTRLRLNHIPYRPLMMSANPEPGWLHRKMVRDATPITTEILRRNGQPLKIFKKDDYLFVPSFPEDNEHLPDGYIAGLYKSLSPTRVERLLRGIWETVENAAYPQLDREKHLIRLPRDVYWVDGAGGADYGKVHLSTVVSVTKEQNGTYWVRECWADQGGDAQRIEDAARSQKVRFGYQKGRTDPIQAVLAQKLGWNAAKMGKGSRQVRINAVTRLLNNNALYFDIEGAGVMELFEEMQAYRYERRETDMSEEDVIVRKDDDRVAALEYAIEELETAFAYTPPQTHTIKYNPVPLRVGRQVKNAVTALGYRLGR